jgi:hypothetical protein
LVYNVLRNVAGVNMEDSIRIETRKPDSSCVYSMVAVGQLVLLFDADANYINVWTTFDLDNTVPGTLKVRG